MIAMISFSGTDHISLKAMTKVFSSKQQCQQYVSVTPQLSNDALIMEPNQSGHSLVCMNKEEIKNLLITKKSI